MVASRPRAGCRSSSMYRGHLQVMTFRILVENGFDPHCFTGEKTKQSFLLYGKVAARPRAGQPLIIVIYNIVLYKCSIFCVSSTSINLFIASLASRLN